MTTTGPLPKKPTAPPRKPRSVYVWPLTLAGVLVVGLMLNYLFLVPSPVAPASPAAAVEPSVSEATSAKRMVLISSKPSGATIWINNVNTGSVTPSQMEIPESGPFVIMLHKKGYNPFVSDRVLQDMQGKKFEAVLSRPAVRKRK